MNNQSNIVEPLLGHKPLGHIGYGAMRLPGMRGVEPNKKLAHRLLKHAVELGVKVIDTADFYGNGLANQFIYEALSPYSENILISTKVGAKAAGKGLPVPAASADEIIASVSRNIESLRTDVIDIVFMRLAGGRLDDSGIPVQESLSALADLKQQGVIKHIGLSNATLLQLKLANTITTIDAIQNAYFVGYTPAKEVLLECTAKNIPFFAYFPLGVGKISGNPLVKKLASKYETSESKIALAWLLHLSPVMLPIPGTSSMKHLEENMSATDINLEKIDIEMLCSLNDSTLE